MFTELTFKLIKTYIIYGYYSCGTPYCWNNVDSTIQFNNRNLLQLIFWILAIIYSTLVTFGIVLNLTITIMHGGTGFRFDNVRTGLGLMYSAISLFDWIFHINQIMRHSAIVSAINQCIFVFQNIKGKHMRT